VLSGQRLRWYAGSRLLGTGQQLVPAGLPAGRKRITLVARDRAGRLGRASVVVSVAAVRPLFLVLSGPRQVKRTARVLRLKVSSTIDATLTVKAAARGSAQRFAVSRKLRTLRVRIASGRGTLSLRLSLAAAGLSQTRMLAVSRS
jgi:hypothetical protein